MGRAAGGVNGISLGKGDKVASMEVVQPDGDLLLVTARGYGKRTPLSDYPRKSRATGGVQTIQKDALSKVGVITAARIVLEDDDLTIISASGVVLRTRVQDISRSGRATRGVRLMSVEEVMEEVLRDRPFYESSGGGVTLTGGEPSLQDEFTLGILSRCKEKGIHTAIETCGETPWATYTC